MKELHYYGSADLVAHMKDSAGQQYDIVKTTYTIDVWQHMECGGTRLYTMFADMTLTEVIQTLAVDFGLVEFIEGEVV